MGKVFFHSLASFKIFSLFLFFWNLTMICLVLFIWFLSFSVFSLWLAVCHNSWPLLVQLFLSLPVFSYFCYSNFISFIPFDVVPQFLDILFWFFFFFFSWGFWKERLRNYVDSVMTVMPDVSNFYVSLVYTQPPGIHQIY